MKRRTCWAIGLIILLCGVFTFLLLIENVALAQNNRLTKEEARQCAKLCVEQAVLADCQIETDVDPNEACAERGERGGAMVIPDKRLSAEMLHKTEKAVTPLGQLWLRKWTTVVESKATPKEKLRVMRINIEDKVRPMPLFLLGIRRTGKEMELELVVYGKDSEPLQMCS